MKQVYASSAAPVVGRVATIVLFLALVAGSALAQPGRGDQRPENLKVLPEDIPQERLRAIMEGFTEALGVNCTHCHVREAGQPPRMNFAADEKPEKETARTMLRMVQAINGEHLNDLPTVEQRETVGVTCMTCHHGLTQPRMLQDVLAATAAEDGLDSTFAQYDALRERYYGTFAYDFSDRSLVLLAERLLEDGNAADALVVLERNLALFPESIGTFLAMSEAYLHQDNRAEAIRSLERAQELQPNNFRVRRQLEELRGQ